MAKDSVVISLTFCAAVHKTDRRAVTASAHAYADFFGLDIALS